MKIAFTTDYSFPSKCGVWNVVYQTAKQLIKRGHEVHIFSSNTIKGTNQKSSLFEVHEKITYHRFPVLGKIGENGQIWNFKKALINVQPDIIHAHAYRHFHANLVPKIAKNLNIPCYLTTHAPFPGKNIRTSKTQKLVDLFDKYIGKKLLNSYSKVFAISQWEIPLLKSIGCEESNIVFLPNGYPQELFDLKTSFKKKAVYLGRISAVKSLETFLAAAKELPDWSFTIHGSKEGSYELTECPKNVTITVKPFDLKEEKKILEKNAVFILPSVTEAVPLALLEAMAAGLVCISSKTRGGMELLTEGKTGLLFPIGNSDALVRAIDKVNATKWKSITSAAKKSVKDRSWEDLVEKVERNYIKDLILIR